jgi:hypothetical protein
MTRLDAHATITEPVLNDVAEGFAVNQALYTSQQEEDRLAWQHIIDRQLIEWVVNPGQLEDDELEPPSREIVALASRFLLFMRDQGMPPPHRVVPDGEGGVIFERKQSPVFETFEISREGSIEYLLFVNSQLKTREPVA